MWEPCPLHKNETKKHTHFFPTNTESQCESEIERTIGWYDTEWTERCIYVCVYVYLCACIECVLSGVARHKRQHQLTCLISCFMCWTQSYLGVRRRWIDSLRTCAIATKRHKSTISMDIHRVCMWRVWFVFFCSFIDAVFFIQQTKKKNSYEIWSQ